MICKTFLCFALLVGIQNNNILENEAYFFTYPSMEECENQKPKEKQNIIKKMIEENNNDDKNFNKNYENFLNEKIFVRCENINSNVFMVENNDIDSYVGMMNRNLLLKFSRKK